VARERAKDLEREAGTRGPAKNRPRMHVLPKDKRQTQEQAKPFAKKAMERIRPVAIRTSR
jgi:hypothetical protein